MKLSLPAAKSWHGGWDSYPGHKGQDFGWGDGDQVLAAAPGEVVEVYGGGGCEDAITDAMIMAAVATHLPPTPPLFEDPGSPA